LIQQEVEPFCVEGIDLLKAMEQTEEEELSDIDPKEKMHLPQRMVETITKVKENGVKMNMSYPIFMSKPSTHRMHDPGSNVPHIRPKVFTENQMS
jgi:hypothetical protein